MERAAGLRTANYNIEKFSADLHVVLGHFDQRPVLVGASLGGITSMLTEGEAPQPVSAGVVLVDVTPRVEQKGVDRIRAFMTARPDGFESLEEVADTIAAYIPHRPRPKDVSGLAKNLRQGEDGRYRWHWDPNLMKPGPLSARPRTAYGSGSRAAAGADPARPGKNSAT